MAVGSIEATHCRQKAGETDAHSCTQCLAQVEKGGILLVLTNATDEGKKKPSMCLYSMGTGEDVKR